MKAPVTVGVLGKKASQTIKKPPVKKAVNAYGSPDG